MKKEKVKRMALLDFYRRQSGPAGTDPGNWRLRHG
jgi:hypothetical protein